MKIGKEGDGFEGVVEVEFSGYVYIGFGVVSKDGKFVDGLDLILGIERMVILLFRRKSKLIVVEGKFVCVVGE